MFSRFWRENPLSRNRLPTDEGIAWNSAARTSFTHYLRRRNRGSLAIFFAEEIAHLGASKNRAIFWGAGKVAAAAAENRTTLVHSESRGGPCASEITIFQEKEPMSVRFRPQL